MKELSKLFGSEARVKLIRLFILNPERVLDSEDLHNRLRIARSKAATESKQLQTIGFLKKKTFYKDVVRRGKKGKKKSEGWYLNENFHYNSSLKALVVDEEILNKKELVRRLRPAGKIKLLIVSGIFMKDKAREGELDMLIVGEHLRKGWVEDMIKKLEAEIGKELSYAIFESGEFKYRLEMYDKLVRDVLDFPHDRLIDALPLSTLELNKS